MSRRALLLGPTGLVGQACLDALVASEQYSAVTVITRRALGLRSEKVAEMRLETLDDLAAHLQLFDVDDVFCCLGSTLKRAGSREAFYRVDHDYCVLAAELAAKQGVRHFAMVSAVNANAASRVFYSRVKGRAEQDVIAQGVPSVLLFQPSFLLGERSERRPGEAMGIRAMGLVRPFLHQLGSSLTPVRATVLARAMLGAALHGPQHGVNRYRYPDFLQWEAALARG